MALLNAILFFQLSGYVFGNQLRVHVGIFHFHDVDDDKFVAHQLLNLRLHLLYARALLANQRAGTTGIYKDDDFAFASLDFNRGNGGLVIFLFDKRPDDLVLFDEFGDVFFVGVPLGIPIFYDTYSQSVGINFLTHAVLLQALSSSTTVMWLVRFKMR